MIRLMGGLGNQMFQYAFGRALSIKYNTELVLDQTLLLDKTSDHSVSTHRNYDLDIFKNLNFRWSTKKEVIAFNGDPTSNAISKLIRKLKNILAPKKLIIQQNNSVLPAYFELSGDTCLVGRWQSYQFFKGYEKEIANDFKLDQPFIPGLSEMLEKIEAKESVCLHVRRGDLTTSPLYSKTIGVLEPSYYEQAIERVNNTLRNAVYFIFSEDLEWCRQNIKTDRPCIYIDASLSGKKAEGHFYLMKNCRHFIISNSTYAWWAAFLSTSENKIVIYPANWFKEKSLHNPLMSPADWIAV